MGQLPVVLRHGMIDSGYGAGMPHRQMGQLPVVLWHGMGDSCCNSWSIGAVRTRIMKALPGWNGYSAVGCAVCLWTRFLQPVLINCLLVSLHPQDCVWMPQHKCYLAWLAANHIYQATS